MNRNSWCCHCWTQALLSILEILDLAVRRCNLDDLFTIISNKIFCPAKQADVTITTSTLLNLAQIAIDAVIRRHSRRLPAILGEKSKVTLAAVSVVFHVNQGNRVETTCGKCRSSCCCLIVVLAPVLPKLRCIFPLHKAQRV
jgi:hypothetical protein